MSVKDNKSVQNARYEAFRASRDERTAAFAMVGGGDHERVGFIEKAILDACAPVPPGGLLVDVGCGPGRLARYLTDRQDLRYIGSDVVGSLLDVARAECARPDWTFSEVAGFEIPAPDAAADVVAIFSVFTNIYPEQSFLLMREAARVLRPGGRLLVTYLDISVSQHQQGFLNLVEHQASRIDPLVYLDRHFLRFFASANGFSIPTFLDPIEVQGTAAPGSKLLDGREISGDLTLGQVVCTMDKPL